MSFPAGSATPMTAVDRFHLGLVERVTRWSALALVAACAPLLGVDPRAAAGLALGGGISLGIVLFYRTLLAKCIGGVHRRRVRMVLWAVWLLKWPALGALLYLVISRAWVPVGWMCVGVVLVPAVATAMALKAAAGGWMRPGVMGARP